MIADLSPSSVTHGAGAPWKTDALATSSASIIAAITKSVYYPDTDSSSYVYYDENESDSPDYLEVTVDGSSITADSASKLYVYIYADWYGFDNLKINAYINGSWVGEVSSDQNGIPTIITFSGTYTQSDLNNLKIRLSDDGTRWDLSYIHLYQIKVRVAYKPINATNFTVPNQSFETPIVADFEYNPSGATWDMTLGGIARNGSFDFDTPTPVGDQVAILQTNAANFFYNFTGLTVGGSYYVNFISACRVATLTGNEVDVKWDSTVIGTFTPGIKWSGYGFGPFVATSTSHTLTFQGKTSADVTSYIDDVVIEEVIPDIGSPSDSPTVHYKLDEVDGSTTAIDSISGKDGTYHGNISFEQEGLVSGTSIDFNRTNTYIDIPKTTVNGLSDFSISFWTVWYGPRSSNQQHIFDFNNGISPTNLTGKYFAFAPDYYKTSKPALIYTTAGASNDQYVNCDTIFPIGTRVFVVITHNDSTTKVYFNGNLVGSNNIDISLSDIQITWIGRSPWASDDYYYGRLDDFKIYNYGLSAQEVTEQYNGANDGIDYLTVGQGVAVQMIYNRSISDNQTINDLLGPEARLEDLLIITTSDSVHVNGNYFRDASDAVYILDSIQVNHVKEAQVEDVLLFTDGSMGLDSTHLTDTLTIVDTADLYQQKLGTANDILIFIETVIVDIPGQFNFVLGDSLSFLETMIRPGGKNASGSDTLLPTDGFTYIGPHPATVKDVWNFSEIVSKIGPNYMAIRDLMNILENVHVSPGKASITDILNFNETLHVSPIWGITNDILDITDSNEYWTNTKTATDTLIITDSVNYHLSIVNVSVTDNLTFLESIILQTPIISIQLTDSLTFNETVKRVQEFDIEDTLTFTETLHRIRTGSVIDTLTFTEDFEAVGSKYNSDTLDFYEEVCLFLDYAPSITDTLTFNDRVAVPNNPNTGVLGGGTFELKGIYNKRVYDRLILLDFMPDIPRSFDNCDRFFNDTLLITDEVNYVIA